MRDERLPKPKVAGSKPVVRFQRFASALMKSLQTTRLLLQTMFCDCRARTASHALAGGSWLHFGYIGGRRRQPDGRPQRGYFGMSSEQGCFSKLATVSPHLLFARPSRRCRFRTLRYPSPVDEVAARDRAEKAGGSRRNLYIRVPIYVRDVDEFDLLMMFRWVQRLVVIALLAGLFLAPDATRRLVTAAVESRAAKITEHFTEALRPALAPKGESTTKKQ
jgi:hypothetical protein